MATATNNRDKPDAVAFDLGTLEYETKPPLTFSFKGKRYTIEDPSMQDYAVLDKVPDGDPGAILKAFMGSDQYEKLAATPGFKGHHAGQLIDRVREHFGQDSGEDSAS